MKTPITYYGGKQRMLKHILPLIPNHTLYTEAFCGGAAVLFAKEPVEAEVINDINSELINFYWVAKHCYPKLKEKIDATLHSRETHAHAKYISDNPIFFTPIDRAWAIWCLSKMSFASKLNGPFGYDFKGKVPIKVKNSKINFTEEICKRLENVTIENQNALKIISRYDRDTAFHFMDPPYFNSNCGHYEGLFNEEHLQQLLTLLKELKGKFMLTMYPYDKIEELAAEQHWTIHKIKRTLSASKTSRKKQEEWIVCNY